MVSFPSSVGVTMSPSLRPSPASRPSLRSNVLWLTRLRWAAIVGQTLTILVTHAVVDVHLRLAPLSAVISAEIGVNALSMALHRRGHEFSRHAIAGLLVFDVVALTGLLHFAGGPSNPFNFLYLVHVVLATVLAGARVAWLLAGVSALLFGALFLYSPGDTGEDDHATMMQWHLQGMWIAFVIAAGLIVYFMGRILSAVEARERELAEAREQARRAEMLSSLATLATGAAHELATPLSTIAVISREFARRLAADPGSASELLDDAVLLRDQVRRCQEIIDQMATGAGQSVGEAAGDVQLGELLAQVLESLDGRGRIDLDVPDAVAGTKLRVPRQGLRRALRAVLENALEASAPQTSVQLHVEHRDGWLEVRVEDCGEGIPEDVLPRVVEPFFSTKPPGRGMGLGLFLADNILRDLGGSFHVGPGRGGEGTCARLVFPVRTG